MSEIKEYSVVEAALSELAIRYKEVPDASTKEGHKACKAGAKEVGKYRIDLESKRVEIKAPALQRCRDIDSEAKRIQAEIAKIEDPLKSAYKKIDDEIKAVEAARVKSITDKIEHIESLAIDLGHKMPEILSTLIEELESFDFENDFDEFTKQALIARNRVNTLLESALRIAITEEAEKKKKNAERLELEELRKAKEQADQKAKEIELQSQLEEQEKNAEKQRLADVAQAEKIGKELAIKAAIDAKQKETDRINAENKAILEKQQKREANKKHVGKICGLAKKSLMQDDEITEELATKIVKMIASGKVECVTINY